MSASEYKNRYCGLHYLLLQAYTDWFFIQEFDKLKSNEEAIQTELYPVLIHICELLKSDLCLSLWKACFDTDSKACSLFQLNRIVKELSGEHTKIRFSTETKQAKKTIDKMRHQVIAHSDANRETMTIPLTSFEQLLKEATEFLNHLYLPKIDPEVRQLSDNEILFLKLRATFGFGSVLRQGIFKEITIGEE